jgi:hypothetical protein
LISDAVVERGNAVPVGCAEVQSASLEPWIRHITQPTVHALGEMREIVGTWLSKERELKWYEDFTLDSLEYEVLLAGA